MEGWTGVEGSWALGARGALARGGGGIASACALSRSLSRRAAHPLAPSHTPPHSHSTSRHARPDRGGGGHQAGESRRGGRGDEREETGASMVVVVGWRSLAPPPPPAAQKLPCPRGEGDARRPLRPRVRTTANRRRRVDPEWCHRGLPPSARGAWATCSPAAVLTGALALAHSPMSPPLCVARAELRGPAPPALLSRVGRPAEAWRGRAKALRTHSAGLGRPLLSAPDRRDSHHDSPPRARTTRPPAALINPLVSFPSSHAHRSGSGPATPSSSTSPSCTRSWRARVSVFLRREKKGFLSASPEPTPVARTHAPHHSLLTRPPRPPPPPPPCLPLP